MKAKTITTLVLIWILFTISIMSFAQTKSSIAVIGIDTKGIRLDNVSLGNLVRLELEKTNRYEVYDKYDVYTILSEKGINPDSCFGKSNLIKAGKMIDVDKVLTGSVERFGEKIIFVLRMIDVEQGVIENSNVMEYLHLEEEIQSMAKISVNNIIGAENDKLLVDLLVDYEDLVSSPKTTVKLNGPRMGIAYVTGEAADRLMAPESEGGYNMFPVNSLFGYQFEVQYLSSGDFQALFEFIPMLNGLETGNIMPSLSILNGFRFNKKGWEFALGPVFRLTQTAEGYYDENGKWHLLHEMPSNRSYVTETAIDSRGDYQFSTSLVVAAGRTFKSGYLNMPLNIYVVPKKEGTTIGLLMGFNVAKRQKRD